MDPHDQPALPTRGVWIKRVSTVSMPLSLCCQFVASYDATVISFKELSCWSTSYGNGHIISPIQLASTLYLLIYNLSYSSYSTKHLQYWGAQSSAVIISMVLHHLFYARDLNTANWEYLFQLSSSRSPNSYWQKRLDISFFCSNTPFQGIVLISSNTNGVRTENIRSSHDAQRVHQKYGAFVGNRIRSGTRLSSLPS